MDSMYKLETTLDIGLGADLEDLPITIHILSISPYEPPTRTDPGCEEEVEISITNQDNSPLPEVIINSISGDEWEQLAQKALTSWAKEFEEDVMTDDDCYKLDYPLH